MEKVEHACNHTVAPPVLCDHLIVELAHLDSVS